MGLALLALLIVSILIGYQAQISKGRTGAAWGLMTLIVLFILFFIFWPDPPAPVPATPAERQNLLQVIETLGQAGFAATLAIVIGGGMMSLIVATLPKKGARGGD